MRQFVGVGREKEIRYCGAMQGSLHVIENIQLYWCFMLLLIENDISADSRVEVDPYLS